MSETVVRNKNETRPAKMIYETLVKLNDGTAILTGVTDHILVLTDLQYGWTWNNQKLEDINTGKIDTAKIPEAAHAVPAV